MSRPIVWVLLGLIRLYQRLLSPLLPSVCRYWPSCSEYFADALQRKGLFKGFALGVWRILRCNPFSRGGFDPVK